jgi:hypothetical protein
MQPDPTPLASPALPARSRPGPLGVVRVAAANLSFIDWFALLFHAAMTARVMVAPDSPEALIARRAFYALIGVTLATLLLVRGELLPAGRVRAFVYRLGLMAPISGSYFVLKYHLPALQPRLLDGTLLALDTAIFGVSPAVFLDRFVTPARTEWFAFFYYSYFFILASYLATSVFAETNRQRLAEISVGGACVACVGHFVYTLVPGMGPHATLAFQNELVGGVWWNTVAEAVSASGAQLDIFPSLHTAYPTFFLLHALRHRHAWPFALAWPVTAFFVLNIVVATVYLRWHWGVDLLAGLALAFTAQRLAIYVDRLQHGADGMNKRLQEAWEPLWRDRGPDADRRID